MKAQLTSSQQKHQDETFPKHMQATKCAFFSLDSRKKDHNGVSEMERKKRNIQIVFIALLWKYNEI